MTEERLVSPRKIAVLHAKALGDFIMILPALTALKQTYPDAELILLTKAWVKEFLSDRPSPVDKIILLPSLRGVTEAIDTRARFQENSDQESESPELERFYKSMRAEHLDLAVQLQDDGHHANRFISRLGATLTAGTGKGSEQSLDLYIPHIHYQNDILRNLEIVKLIGASTDELSPRIETTVKDNREIADVLESFGGNPFIVLHPGAGDIRLRWPPVKFAAVADAFTERGYQIILTGTPKEKALITEIIQYMQRTALAQTSLTLGGLAALLSHASLVIGNDTGPLHLARAVGAKTVGIFWIPNLLTRGPLFRKGRRTAISWKLECPQCGIKPVSPYPFLPVTERCDHAFSFVESVPITEVIALADELLKDARSSTA